MAKKSRRQKLPTEKDLEKLSAPKAGESGATPDSRSDRSEASDSHSDCNEAPQCHFERSEAESRNLGLDLCWLRWRFLHSGAPRLRSK